jgi:F-type H+-transporting ATPase subunit gamma
VIALYPVHDDRATHVIETRLFPVEPERLRSPGVPPPRLPPRTFVPPEEVVDRLVEEWIYTELYRAALEAFTAEQTARLRTTDAATGTIDRKLVGLRLEHNRSRQEQITNEVQEVIVATEAMGMIP